jgi:hypothetical protein
MTSLRTRIDDIDVQIERIRKAVEAASFIDPEIAAGMATTTSMGAIQRSVDQAAACSTDLDWAVRDSLRAS